MGGGENWGTQGRGIVKAGGARWGTEGQGGGKQVLVTGGGGKGIWKLGKWWGEGEGEGGRIV